MNVREALETLIDRAATPEEIEVEYVALKVEEALRASAWKMADLGLRLGETVTEEALAKCVTAGIEKLAE